MNPITAASDWAEEHGGGSGYLLEITFFNGHTVTGAHYAIQNGVVRIDVDNENSDEPLFLRVDQVVSARVRWS